MSAGNTQALLSQSPTIIGDEPVSYASIEGDNSHRKNKKFKQRLKYRLNQGCSYDEAFVLASAKEFVKNPALRLVPNPANSEVLGKSSFRLDENYPQNSVQKLNNFYRDESQKNSGRNSSDVRIPLISSASFFPSADEIRLEIEKMKLAGLMTEIPTRTNFVSSAEPSSSSSPSSSSAKSQIQIASDSSPSLAPYWTVSTLACIWLVYSMTTSLPGHWFWNLLIAIAFEFTPMLMLGARVERKHQRTVTFGAVGIFTLGLGLYLAPSVQMLWNESSAYVEASSRYESDVREYEGKAYNTKALILAAKSDAEISSQGYEAALSAYGENSWRTAVAKKQKVSDAAEWKRLSKDADIPKAPLTPKISDDLTKALQAIATRIGLFAVVFLSMFVMQRLERPETA